MLDEQIGSSIVYRGFQELEVTGRGVRSLASEPSVFGNLLLILSGFLMLIAIKDSWSVQQLVASQAAVLLATIVLPQSSYGIAIQFCVFLATLFVVSFKLFLAVGIFAAWGVVGYFERIDAEGVRAIFILQTLIENPVLLYEQGAILRVMNVPVSLYGGMLHGIFGSGFGTGNMGEGTIPTLPGYPIPFEIGDRNVGGLVELFLRLGIGAIPLLLFYLVQIFRIGRISLNYGDQRVNIGFPLALVVFLVFFTYSSI
jgi:hypothetical protein